MNKKLLFGIMSLAALTACTNDDFQSRQVAEEASPIQFEVLNNAMTRASMNGNKIEWSAADGDLFTLYHGGAGITGYENATYKAAAEDGAPATLTTPSMIKAGLAVMVWPVDTTFRIRPANNLSIVIPADQSSDIENNIPYMSDQITISAYGTGYDGTHNNVVSGATESNSLNTEGKDRKYPVYMRPMASQLIVKADYAGTDATLAELEAGDDGIEPIALTSLELLTTLGGGGDEFTTDIDVKWTAPTAAINTQWAAVANNAWTAVTDFDLTAINASSDYLETECLTGNESGKFLLLPQAGIAGGVADGAVVVNTIYGKVVVAAPGINGSLYTAAEANDAWYRFISAASKTAGPGVGYDATETPAATAGSDGKFKTTSLPANGMMQTINGFSTYTHQAAGVVKGEPEGAAATRYVKVLLTHLDMSDLHVKSDKQLRDAARVWQKMGLTDVTVFLDGDSKNEFAISQKTIKTINDINAAVPGAAKSFKVKPCTIGTHKNCNTIVITGGGNVQDITFIEPNGVFAADVALKAGETWAWKDATGEAKIVKAKAVGVAKFINRGTFVCDANAILQTAEPNGTQNFIPFENARNAKWNVNKPATIRVQFDVTNYGTVTIEKGAQYRQDGNAGATVFTNEATRIPSRFIYGAPRGDAYVGTVWNYGVFATLGTGAAATINNYGLIEHADKDAKTYITANDNGGAGFGTAFGGGNKMGRINLPWLNRDEDNISISAALNSGFVSLTVDDTFTNATLNIGTGTIGDKVNYLKVNSASVKEITGVVNQIDYLEIQAPNEIAWNVTGPAYNFIGLMVLTDVNIKLGTTVNVTGATYLGADMYVGGTFNNASWSGYFGNTAGNVATKYITY